MEKVYVLVKSWSDDDYRYDVKVLGVSTDANKLREIIYKDVAPLMEKINEDAAKFHDPEDWDGEPFKPWHPDVMFLDQDTKLNWYDDTIIPTDYTITESEII